MDHFHFRFSQVLKGVRIVLFSKRACLELLVVVCKGCVNIMKSLSSMACLSKLDQEGSLILHSYQDWGMNQADMFHF